MGRGATRDELLRLLEPVTAAAGLDLEDVEVTPAGRRRVVRVVVDRDGGVSLDSVAQVSQQLSAVLDAPGADAALGGAPYVLEVTSPGVDRPLTHPRHWRRARSRLVTAGLADGGEVTGRVVEVGEGGPVLEVHGAARALRWDEVRRGRVQVEFSRRAGGQDEDGREE